MEEKISLSEYRSKHSLYQMMASLAKGHDELILWVAKFTHSLHSGYGTSPRHMKRPYTVFASPLPAMVVLKNLVPSVALDEREERRAARLLWKVPLGVKVMLVVQLTSLNTEAADSVALKMTTKKKIAIIVLAGERMIFSYCYNEV